MRTEFGRFTRQVSGYSMEHLLPERGRDVGRFLVGSEGTLGARPGRHRAAGRRGAAPRLVVLGLPVDGRGRRRRPRRGSPPRAWAGGLRGPGRPHRRPGPGRRRAVPDLPRGAGWLFVEVGGDAAGLAAAGGSGAASEVVADSSAAALWRIREDGAGLAARSLSRPAYSGWEDAAVPPARLGAWLRDFDELLGEHELDGRALRPLRRRLRARADRLPLRRGRAGRKVFRAFLEDAADGCVAHGGSLSGEHGDGRARSELLPLMYDAESIGCSPR